jgi:hypothetical protein
MPKNILFESAVNHFLRAAQSVIHAERESNLSLSQDWESFIASLNFLYEGKGTVSVTWSKPSSGATTFVFKDARFYTRGKDANPEIESHNLRFFIATVLAVAGAAGLRPSTASTALLRDAHG